MKRILRNDIARTFFKEFAERINFCGIRLNAIITNVKKEGKLNGRAGFEHDADIIAEHTKKISIKSKDLPLKIKIGEEVSVNSEKYSVKNIYEKDNITHIFIEKYGD